MKIAAIAVAATIAATSASAAELGATGISLGAELDSAYNVDQENMKETLTPTLGYKAWGADFSLSSDLAIYDDEFVAGDTKPTLDFGAEYGMSVFGLNSTAYVETGYDLEEKKMGDVIVGAKFSF